MNTPTLNSMLPSFEKEFELSRALDSAQARIKELEGSLNVLQAAFDKAVNLPSNKPLRWRRFSDEKPTLHQPILTRTTHLDQPNDFEYKVFSRLDNAFRDREWIPYPLPPLPKQESELDACDKAFYERQKQLGVLHCPVSELELWRAAWTKAREQKL